MSEEAYIPPYILKAMQAQGAAVELVEELLLAPETPTATCPKCNDEVEDADGLGVLHHEACGYCAHPNLDAGVCSICGTLVRVEQTALAIPPPDREGGFGFP